MGWNRCAVCGKWIGMHTQAQIDECQRDPRWPLTWKRKKPHGRRNIAAQSGQESDK